jgi:threonine/homoserine/homoserine lactone efflux protein
VAFTAVKFAGAAYLVYLGIQALRRPKVQEASLSQGTAERRRIFRDGFFVALLNPKTTIFFAAFLPQFIESTSSPVFQGIALSAAFVLIAACTDSAYVMLSTAFAPALRAGRPLAAYGRLFSAFVYFGLGIYTVLAEAHTSRAARM